jgi:rhamnosyltransferase
MQDHPQSEVLVLLSAYNGETFIGQQLDSILHQSYQGIDIVIRDDGSTDHTNTILAEYKKRYDNITIITGENLGCARSFWKLFEYAKTKGKDYSYYALCDQDDFWLEDKIAVAVDYLKKNQASSETPLLYCSNLTTTDANLNITGSMRTALPEVENKAQSLVESFATGCTMVFNRKLLTLATSYQVEHLAVHDLWLFHTCMFLGKIHYDPKAYILYRQHGNNAIGSKTTFFQRLRSKFKSFKTLGRQHFREEEAKELLQAYGSLLSAEDRHLLTILATYRHCLRYRIGWLFGILPEAKGMRMSNFKDNFFLKIRILIGKV